MCKWSDPAAVLSPANAAGLETDRLTVPCQTKLTQVFTGMINEKNIRLVLEQMQGILISKRWSKVESFPYLKSLT